MLGVPNPPKGVVAVVVVGCPNALVPNPVEVVGALPKPEPKVPVVVEVVLCGCPKTLLLDPKGEVVGAGVDPKALEPKAEGAVGCD